jgi:formylglycine-generating enzyme required for sulfatase activity
MNIANGQDKNAPIPDGMALIPGGTYMMGTDNGQAIAAPKHPVTLSAFYMDIHEVSNREYYEFCIATGNRFPEFWGMELYKSGLDFPDHPVVGVSHLEATRYAEWAGKRLPTEAEWEHAARGSLEDISFPYGENADHSMARFNHPVAEKGPVNRGSYPPNGYGLYDMPGNGFPTGFQKLSTVNHRLKILQDHPAEPLLYSGVEDGILVQDAPLSTGEMHFRKTGSI